METICYQCDEPIMAATFTCAYCENGEPYCRDCIAEHDCPEQHEDESDDWEGL